MLKKIHKKRVQRLIAYINLTVLIFLIVVVYYDYSKQGLTYWLSKNNLYEVKAYFETLSPLMSYFTACLLVLIEVVIGLIPGIIMYPILGFVLGAEKALIVIAKKPIFDLTFEDFELQDYNHHKFIKFPIAV